MEEVLKVIAPVLLLEWSCRTFPATGLCCCPLRSDREAHLGSAMECLAKLGPWLTGELLELFVLSAGRDFRSLRLESWTPLAWPSQLCCAFLGGLVALSACLLLTAMGAEASPPALALTRSKRLYANWSAAKSRTGTEGATAHNVLSSPGATFSLPVTSAVVLLLQACTNWVPGLALPLPRPRPRDTGWLTGVAAMPRQRAFDVPGGKALPERRRAAATDPTAEADQR